MEADSYHEILDNSHRPYFGLEPIDPEWDELLVKQYVRLFYSGDVIKKIISLHSRWQFLEYEEFDTELQTRDRLFLLPKTSRGKERKMTESLMMNLMPDGCRFSLKIGSFSSVGVWNPRNKISLCTPCESDSFPTKEDFYRWRDLYISESPDDHFEKVARMKDAKSATKRKPKVRYSNGDVFRFEIDREHYGFGLIIGQIVPMRKAGLLPEYHVLHDVMTHPLLIRVYRIKTKRHDMPLDEITAFPLLPVDVVSDNQIHFGTVSIVGNKALQESDIDFPMHVGMTLSTFQPKLLRFCWGTGIIVKQAPPNIPVFKRPGEEPAINFQRRFLNNGVNLGIHTAALKRDLNGESPRSEKCDLCHPSNADARSHVFKFFQLPEETTFDDFNKMIGGLTRAQYLEYCAGREIGSIL